MIEEHGDAVEYDLIALGLRLRDLGSAAFNWRDLWVVVKHAPSSSALTLSVDGTETIEWDLTRQLLADVADTLHLLWWAKTTDGQANPPRNQPEPIPRPGVEDDTKRIGDEPMDFDEMRAWLDGDFVAAV